LSDPGRVRLRAVTKVYESEKRGLRLRDAIPGSHLRPHVPNIAIDDADLDVAPGETVAFVGGNGAGKSTILKLIAGITRPTSGSVEGGGRIGSMIELGLGFHTELTGWENIECSAMVLGLSREELADAAPAIAEFSGVEDALDAPLRTYSLGMRARLGFAVATQVRADLLLVDEVLAVGDPAFQVKCLRRIAELAATGVTVLFVSHDMSLVRSVCERAVWLRDGRVVDDGPSGDVVARYLSRSTSRYRTSTDSPLRFERCQVVPEQIESWDPIRVEADVHVLRPVRAAELAIEISRLSEAAEPPFGFATVELPELREPGRYLLRGTSIPYPGGAGSVGLAVSLVDGGRHELSDRAECVVRVPGLAPPRNVHLAVAPGFEMGPIPDRRGPMVPDAPSLQHWADMPTVARLRDVTKRFADREQGRRARLALPGRAGRRPDREFTAIDRLSLDIHAGTALGVIGVNGAGKSTLLRLLAGVARPDGGQVAVRGRVVPVLDLGLGFHPHLTGRQNLTTSARLLGLSDEEIEDRAASIIEFAELAEVMDQTVNHYSTGMRARLGLAVAVHTAPDILLIDELLAVGDRDFRRKALDRVRQVRDDGAAVVLVSHGLRLIEELCDRVIRLEDGRVVDDGLAAHVVERYGGSSAIGGAADAGSGIRIHEVSVRRHHVPVGGTIEFKGVVEVATPSPHARLELSYRARVADRDQELTPEEILDRTFYLVTLEPDHGRLDQRSWYEFTGDVTNNSVEGAFDLVVSVFDQREQTIISESWQEVSVGDDVGDQMGWRFAFDWEVEKMARAEDLA
jgi:ABC-type polysaccharide/polyol phosphate transport system ATPase subunit